MKRSKFQRCLATALALLLTAAVPVTALADSAEPRELVATDITLDQTRFEYTGEEIRPNVTVRVEDHLLTLDRDYTLEYRDNVEVGTAAVVVTAMEGSGYTGTAEHPFYIDPRTTGEDSEDPLTIQSTDVVMEGTEFPYTGQAVEPAVTVTVADKVLTAGEDYTLVYADNVEPGTASATVTGVADKGYTGSVTVHFTILEAPTEPEETQPEETQPQETQPQETQPEETKPEETQPEETKPEAVSYKITKGDGAAWHRNSGKDLSFTLDPAPKALEKVLIDGKTVSSKYYTLEEGGVVTLKAQLLQVLDLGKHSLVLTFADGQVEGSFRTSAPADESNPKTGDSSGLHLWTALLFVSLTAISGMAFLRSRKSRPGMPKA